MNARRARYRTSYAAGPASTAGALVALVALAAVMSSLPGGNVRSSLIETRVASTEAPTVRQVAEAVAAAARELVGAEQTTAALSADPFIKAIAVSDPAPAIGYDAAVLPLARPIAERLIDLPPPVC